MLNLDKFEITEQHPVVVTMKEQTYIREGNLMNALKIFRRPAYGKEKSSEK